MPPKKRKSSLKESAKESKKAKKGDTINEETAPVQNNDSLKSKGHGAPSVSKIVLDPITSSAMELWPSPDEGVSNFNQEQVESLYQEEIKQKGFDLSRIMLLELSRYLEKYVLLTICIPCSHL